MAFLEHPGFRLGTSPTENEVRSIAFGRREPLAFGSETARPMYDSLQPEFGGFVLATRESRYQGNRTQPRPITLTKYWKSPD